MSDQGERGPRGDTGQSGDIGQTGRTGQTGDTGDTGDIGKTGLVGDTGERGPTGDLGPHGPTGPVGERGKAGKIPPEVVRAFIALGATAFLVLAIVGCQVRSNRDLIHKVQAANITSQELQREATDSCQNYLELRDTVNDFHSAMIGLLKTAHKARIAAYKRTHHRSDLEAARSYQTLLKSLHTVSRTCAQRRGT